MTILLNKIKKILSATDYFNSLSMLRFQKEDEYKTISGGLLSLGIIVVIMVAFTREILVTMDRTSMQVKSNVVKVEVPTKARLNLRPQQNQMFALLIEGVSPSDSIRYFDVIAQIFDFNTAYPGRSPDSVAVKMGQCTDDHWTGFENVYTTKSIDQLFCPELGTNLDIFGKVTTGKQRNLKILASVCNPYSTDTRPCASQQQMSEFWTRHGGSTQFYLFYLNAILTPDQTDYKQIYFEQRQFGFIAPTFGNDVTLSLSDYLVSTDQSIWPFKDQINQSGLFAPNGLKKRIFQRPNPFHFI